MSSSGSNGSRYVRVGSGSWQAGGLSWGGMGQGTWTGYAYATDGFNDTAVLSCTGGVDDEGYVVVAAPPLPPAPAGYTTTWPGCDGRTIGRLQGVWYDNFSAYYYPPEPFILYFQVTSRDANGDPQGVAWGINSEHMTNAGKIDWTGGVALCGGGNVGV